MAGANKAAEDALEALRGVDMRLVSGGDHLAWMKAAEALRGILGELAKAADIEAARQAFSLYSQQMAALVERFGPGEGEALYLFKCPMAFDNRGAVWLQDHREVRNPYFGKVMPGCGEVQEVITAPERDDVGDRGMEGPDDE